ncbi:copper resistance protein [Streptomyces sp. NRRL S-444]|nr:copper resistance protein [Streptomyces sp. NRRL S-444]
MTTKRSLIRRATAVAAAATAALVLAACGGNGDDNSSTHNGHNAASPSASAPAQQGDHNAADVAFAQGMIPHHRQAIEMADLAATRAESAEVKKLAGEIKKAQDPEIKTLSGWLTSWGEQLPAEGQGQGHGGHDMSGMMSAEEMRQLESSSGKAFDTAFLTMMVKHHEGAVAMAKTEQSDGTYQPAKDMAGAIITSQSAEIARMNTLLGKS